MRPEIGPVFRILTINTAKCDEPYSARIDALAARIPELQPDIVACQEVFATADGQVSTAARIGESLGYHRAAIEARHKARPYEGRPVQSSSGLAIFSRWPFERTYKVHLPSDERDGERAAQIAAIRLPGGSRLAVANLHLTHLPGASRLRACQLGLALRILAAEAGTAPSLAMGDFNARVESPELACWTGHRAPGSLVDGFLCGGGDPAATTTLHGRSRIDHVFGVRSPGVDWDFFGARVVLGEIDAAVRGPVSDHLGILVSAKPRRLQ